METVEFDGNKYEVIGHAEDGLPVIRGIATTTEDGTDEEGNKKLSVEIKVPPIDLGAEPGKAE